MDLKNTMLLEEIRQLVEYQKILRLGENMIDWWENCYSGQRERSNMALLEVPMLSGYIPVKKSVKAVR
ncbi:UNVERIFIED_CONTAM: hypothetical protein K2H54_009711 [Gekko kuhli]